MAPKAPLWTYDVLHDSTQDLGLLDYKPKEKNKGDVVRDWRRNAHNAQLVIAIPDSQSLGQYKAEHPFTLTKKQQDEYVNLRSEDGEDAKDIKQKVEDSIMASIDSFLNTHAPKTDRKIKEFIKNFSHQGFLNIATTHALGMISTKGITAKFGNVRQIFVPDEQGNMRYIEKIDILSYRDPNDPEIVKKPEGGLPIATVTREVGLTATAEELPQIKNEVYQIEAFDPLANDLFSPPALTLRDAIINAIKGKSINKKTMDDRLLSNVSKIKSYNSSVDRLNEILVTPMLNELKALPKDASLEEINSILGKYEDLIIAKKNDFSETLRLDFDKMLQAADDIIEEYFPDEDEDELDEFDELDEYFADEDEDKKEATSFEPSIPAKFLILRAGLSHLAGNYIRRYPTPSLRHTNQEIANQITKAADEIADQVRAGEITYGEGYAQLLEVSLQTTKVIPKKHGKLFKGIKTLLWKNLLTEQDRKTLHRKKNSFFEKSIESLEKNFKENPPEKRSKIEAGKLDQLMHSASSIAQAYLKKYSKNSFSARFGIHTRQETAEKILNVVKKYERYPYTEDKSYHESRLTLLKELKTINDELSDKGSSLGRELTEVLELHLLSSEEWQHLDKHEDIMLRQRATEFKAQRGNEFRRKLEVPGQEAALAEEEEESEGDGMQRPIR